METHIFFVRHGRTENEGHIIYGRMPGYPLSTEGRAEANKAGEALKSQSIAKIFTSPLERTFQTADIISQHCPNTHIEHIFDLTETESTLWQGLAADLLFTNNSYETFINDPDANIGTENLSQIASRMNGVVEGLLKNYQGKNIVCVSHEFPILCLKFFFENKQLSSIKTVHLKTGGILEFVFDENNKFERAQEISV